MLIWTTTTIRIFQYDVLVLDSAIATGKQGIATHSACAMAIVALWFGTMNTAM